MFAPSARTSSGSSVLTVAFVPTGMKAGVGRSPCAVRRTAARAAPSVALTVNRSLIDAHVAVVDDEVAAVLEAEPLVVRADAGILGEAVEPEVFASGRGRGGVRPLHDDGADPLPRAGAADGELVHVGRVRG